MEVILKQDVDASACAARSSTSPAAMRATSCSRAGSPSRRRRRSCGSSRSATSSGRATRRRRSTRRSAIANRLEALELRFDVNAGPTGSLFGSVTATNVADRLWEEEKIRVDRRKLQMDTIKRIGRYTVPVEVFADVVAELKLVVAPEGEELPPQAELAALEAEETAAAEAAAQAARRPTSSRRSVTRLRPRPRQSGQRRSWPPRTTRDRRPRPPKPKPKPFLAATRTNRPSRTQTRPSTNRPSGTASQRSSTGSPPACGQLPTGYPQGDRACGSRPKFAANSVRSVHYQRTNTCSIIPACAAPPDPGSTVSHTLSVRTKARFTTRGWPRLPRRSRPPRSRRRTSTPRSPSSAR